MIQKCFFIIFFLAFNINFAYSISCKKIFQKEPLNTVVLVRHGQSVWNEQRVFTGWEDIDLTQKGVKEACRAGVLLKNKGFVFNCAFASELKRSMQTLQIVLDEMSHKEIPITTDWRINERHLGILQGLGIKESEKIFGKELVTSWRKDFLEAPLKIKSDSDFNSYENNRQAPNSESFENLQNRVLPFWKSVIWPEIKKQDNIIVSSHLNTLRVIIKHLERKSNEDISSIEVPTGVPIVYRLNSEGFMIAKEILSSEN